VIEEVERRRARVARDRRASCTATGLRSMPARQCSATAPDVARASSRSPSLRRPPRAGRARRRPRDTGRRPREGAAPIAGRRCQRQDRISRARGRAAPAPAHDELGQRLRGVEVCLLAAVAVGVDRPPSRSTAPRSLNNRPGSRSSTRS
jgi:hypothetical protein